MFSQILYLEKKRKNFVELKCYGSFYTNIVTLTTRTNI